MWKEGRNGAGGRNGHMKVKGLIVFMLIRFCFDIYINVQISIIKFVWHFIECACFIEFSLIISATEFHSISFSVPFMCVFLVIVAVSPSPSLSLPFSFFHRSETVDHCQWSCSIAYLWNDITCSSGVKSKYLHNIKGNGHGTHTHAHFLLHICLPNCR